MDPDRDFDRIAAEHERRIVRYLANLLGDVAKAQDLAQETFLSAHKSLGELRSSQSRTGWIYLEGLGEEAVAEILDCSVGAVKVRTHRARKKLRERLSEGCRVYQDSRGVLLCNYADGGEGRSWTQ